MFEESAEEKEGQNLLKSRAQQTRIKNSSAFPDLNSRDFKLGRQ